MHGQEEQKKDAQLDGSGAEGVEPAEDDLTKAIDIGGEEGEEAVFLFGFPSAGAESYGLSMECGADAISDLNGGAAAVNLGLRVESPAERHQRDGGEAECEDERIDVGTVGHSEVDLSDKPAPGLLATVPEGSDESLIAVDEVCAAVDAGLHAGVGRGAREELDRSLIVGGDEEVLARGEEIDEEEEVEEDEREGEGACGGPEEGLEAVSAPEFA